MLDTSIEWVKENMPKSGTFLAVYQDVDSEPKELVGRVSLVAYKITQYTWLNGKLYEACDYDTGLDCYKWCEVIPDNEAMFLHNEAKALRFVPISDERTVYHTRSSDEGTDRRRCFANGDWLSRPMQGRGRGGNTTFMGVCARAA